MRGIPDMCKELISFGDVADELLNHSCNQGVLSSRGTTLISSWLSITSLLLAVSLFSRGAVPTVCSFPILQATDKGSVLCSWPSDRR